MTEKNKLICREARNDDIDLYFIWANDEDVRSNSFHSDGISREVHEKWFHDKLENPECILIIFFYNGNAVGQVRIDGTGKKKVNISLDKKYRGMGLAPELLKLAVGYYYKKKNSKNSLFAYIKKDNLASIKSFENAGFHFFKKELMHNVLSNIMVFNPIGKYK